MSGINCVMSWRLAAVRMAAERADAKALARLCTEHAETTRDWIPELADGTADGPGRAAAQARYCRDLQGGGPAAARRGARTGERCGRRKV
jgi:hypothetical protein